MPFYLYQVSYSQEAVKAMVAKPSDRQAAASKIADATGGKLHHMFFAFGSSDVVCLIEAPDDKSMAAVALWRSAPRGRSPRARPPSSSRWRTRRRR